MKPCVIAESKNSFSFRCDSGDLSKAITKVVTVADFSKGNEDKAVHLIASYKGALFLIGYSTETFSAFQIDGVKTTGDGSFAFTAKTLLGLIKNRSELEFKFEKGRLYFSATKGKYSGDIAATATPPEAVILVNKSLKIEKQKTTTVTGDLLKVLREALKNCNLTNLFEIGDPINCQIRAKDGVLDVSAYDNVHIAYFKSKIDSKANFKMSLPINMFNLIDRFTSTEGEQVEFILGGKAFVAFGDSYIISLPPVQVEDSVYEMAINYIKQLKNPTAELVFKEEGIKTVDNMFTIADETSRLALTVSSKGKAQISLSNDAGKIVNEFKTESKINAKVDKLTALIDPRVFGDLFSKCSSKEVPMQMFQSKDKDVSSSFMITNHTKGSKTYLIGSYEYEKQN